MPSIDMAAYMKRRRANRRNTLIEMAGGKCVRCGADGQEFDHRDRTTKLFVLSGDNLDKAWVKILEEFEKCDFLCSPCHRIKTKENKEFGYQNGPLITEHGTEATYARGCKCDPCREARHYARVQRGELKGTRGPRKHHNPR